MPKLPSLNPRKIIKILEKRGFVLDRTRGSHHIYYHAESKKDLPKGTLVEILKQAGISREELVELL